MSIPIHYNVPNDFTDVLSSSTLGDIENFGYIVVNGVVLSLLFSGLNSYVLFLRISTVKILL
jgi:hypothetical protein